MIKLLSMILMCLCLAVPAHSDDGDAILQKVDRNLNPEAFEMYADCAKDSLKLTLEL